MFVKSKFTLLIVISLIVGMLSPVMSAPSAVQDSNQDSSPDIIIEGPVESINLNLITIADIDIALDINEPLLNTVQIGDVVLIEGDFDNAVNVPVVQGRSIVITNSNIITPVVTITGPIQAVNVNIITVFNLNIQFNPSDPILLDLNIGDTIQVNGSIASMGGIVVVVPVQTVIIINLPDFELTPEATAETTPDPEATPEATPGSSDQPVTIVVEGPVQNINVNIITVFDFDIEVNPSDPILVDLEIGDNIRVEGNTRFENGHIIIMAVNVVIINVVIIDQPNQVIIQPGLPDGCRRTSKGKIKCTRRSGRSSRRS